MIYIELTVPKIVKALRSIEGYKCPACGHENFKVLSFDGGLKPSIRDTIEIDMEYQPDGFLRVTSSSQKQNSIAATVQVICTRCGHVSNHNYFALCELVTNLGKQNAQQ